MICNSDVYFQSSIFYSMLCYEERLHIVTSCCSNAYKWKLYGKVSSLATCDFGRKFKKELWCIFAGKKMQDGYDLKIH